MKVFNSSEYWMAAAALVFFSVGGFAQGTRIQGTENQTAAAAQKRVIVISLEDRKLALLEDGQVKKVYNVAVGKPSTPSPVGTFTIERRVANPVYRHGDKIVQPGPGNPVGTRWMGLSKPGYGIHGTNEPASIGKAASHGCIRMAKPDLEEFYGMVQVGDTVQLIGQRNDETALLFGNSVNPAAPATAQPLQVASNAPSAPLQHSAPYQSASATGFEKAAALGLQLMSLVVPR
jgi:hypothetical protein